MGSHEVQRCESPIEVTPHLDQRQDTRGGLVNADLKPLAIDICGGEKYHEKIKPLNWAAGRKPAQKSEQGSIIQQQT